MVKISLVVKISFVDTEAESYGFSVKLIIYSSLTIIIMVAYMHGFLIGSKYNQITWDYYLYAWLLSHYDIIYTGSLQNLGSRTGLDHVDWPSFGNQQSLTIS